MSVDSILTMPRGGYRSSLVEVKQALNPLVAAAAPLLYLNDALISETILEHELKTFYYLLEQTEQPADVLEKAALLVQQFLIEKSSLPLKAEPNDFYTLLELCAKNPSLYFPVLELGYLCLSLGYEGSLSAEKRELVIENLYALLQTKPPVTPITRQALIPAVKKPWQLPSIPLVFLLALISLGMLFIPYAKPLTQQAYAVAQQVIDLGQAHDER